MLSQSQSVQSSPAVSASWHQLVPVNIARNLGSGVPLTQAKSSSLPNAKHNCCLPRNDARAAALLESLGTGKLVSHHLSALLYHHARKRGLPALWWWNGWWWRVTHAAIATRVTQDPCLCLLLQRPAPNPPCHLQSGFLSMASHIHKHSQPPNMFSEVSEFLCRTVKPAAFVLHTACTSLTSLHRCLLSGYCHVTAVSILALH